MAGFPGGTTAIPGVNEIEQRGGASIDPGFVGDEFDMTQAEFAERIGISQNYLSTMGRGKGEIGADILLRISREFVKSVEWLLTGEA